MTKQIWFNLPVKDITKSKEFFKTLGFTPTQYGNTAESAGFLIGEKNVVIMLFVETAFKNIVANQIADTKQVSEVLISIDAESRKEVDEMAATVIKTGGTLFSKPAEHQGWMYGFGFSDLDGHRWNVLHMDMSKMPK
jgi:predicted lactoylglutathione lyase